MILLAHIIDLLIGDPTFLKHPVIYIGKIISIIDNWIRAKLPEKVWKAAGILLWFIPVGLSYSFGVILFNLKNKGFIFTVIYLWFLSTTLATKGLIDKSKDIYNSLDTGDIVGARIMLSQIVGRDTDVLDEGEIVRGTVETLAENTVDGIISPMFYGFIGGLPLAMAYKGINTLDSMIGYKSYPYKDLGWFSAKVDDIANYIPARITGGIMVLIGLILGLDWKRGINTILKDSKKHPSPNGGIPESAIAGLLGISLGGINYYKGVPSSRGVLGCPLRERNKEDILTTIRIVYLTPWIFLISGYLIFYLIVGDIL